MHATLGTVIEPPYRRPEPDPFLAAWAKLPARRRAGVGGMIAVLCASMAAPVFLYRAAWLWFAALPAVMVVAAYVAQRWVTPFACPRCGEPFFRNLLAEMGFTRHCWACGIEVGTPKLGGDDDARRGEHQPARRAGS